MAQTAPQGYSSAYAALLDLIRFAWAIAPSQTAALALIYHAERSISYGRAEDQHSQRQAEEGIWSARTGQWVRGPSGLKRTAWKAANAELEAAELVSRIRRENRHGKYDATEFAVCWANVRAAIDALRFTRATQAEPEREKEESAKGMAAGRPVIGREATIDWSRGDHTPRPASDWPRGGHTVSQSLSLTEESVTVARARSGTSTAAHQLAAAIEAATGEKPTDRLTNTLSQIAGKLSLPQAALQRWIQGKCDEVRARGYPLRAGLLIKAASEELIGWIKSHRELVADLQRAEQLAEAAPADVREIAAPGFATDLINEISAARRARKKGA